MVTYARRIGSPMVQLARSALLHRTSDSYHLMCREVDSRWQAKRTGSSSMGTDETSEDMCALFGANCRQARLKAKLTQTDVQELTGIRQNYISEIENGVQNLTLDTMTTLARAVGTDVRALFEASAQTAIATAHLSSDKSHIVLAAADSRSRRYEHAH